MKLRYRFEAGAGVCLWSCDDEAREQYGYAVSLEDLPVSNATAAVGQALMSTFDGAIDWANPAGASLWSDDERRRFETDRAQFFKYLCTELAGRCELSAEPFQD